MMFKVLPTIPSSSTEEACSKSSLSRARWFFLDVVLWIILITWASTHLIHNLYSGPIQTLIESYRRTGDVDHEGFYPDFFPDLTYYGRQCDATDITTSNSNDLILPPEVTKEEATDIMMTHGAVLIQNLLSKETATELRAYLETRNAIKDELPWHEKFWGDIGRLSLGLGVDDAPIIGRALEEVGSNPTLRTVLEGIVGPDPAIVEISTLTTMHGAKVQAIHTDSDYFGSSLLYSRTFLHSYTLFMALQDTTSKMGATTVCPGTQWCANEDLADVCLPISEEAPHAFEVSSNGQTGRETGMLYQGDGMMFNQNIWHRGPRNLDPERPINRVMFILTFVSRRDHAKGDVRQQGLGTYYYQRWNMWGHTFQDLKRATQVMTQPLAALRALGIWKLPSTEWGVLWLEHFARQLANKEDFFSVSELPDFLTFLDSIGVPKWLQGRDQQRKKQDKKKLKWEPFLKQLIANAVDFVDRIHLVTLGAYVAIHILSSLNSRHGPRSIVKRTLFKYLVTGLLSLAVWHYVTKESHLAKRIHMRDTWRQPFSHPSSTEHLESTTFPTRYDVLVGNRFDAPYLASFNQVLDYHPGNKEFLNAVDSFNSLELLRAFVSQPRQGVTPRFLQQDWQTGYWSLMNPQETKEYIQRQVYAKCHPLIARLDTDLKVTIADARFGLNREKIMSRKFTTELALDMQTKLYRQIKSSQDRLRTLSITSKRSNKTTSLLLRRTVVHSPTRCIIKPKTSSTILVRNPNGSLRLVRQGDRVLATLPGIGERVEATIIRGVSDRTVLVESTFDHDMNVVSVADIGPYTSFVQGDKVEVLNDEENVQWIQGKIMLIHPLGHADILCMDSNGVEELVMQVPLDRIRFVKHPFENLEVIARIHQFTKGDRVQARFHGDNWFSGVIDQVNDDGTVAVVYDDGDFEANVPFEFLLPLPNKKNESTSTFQVQQITSSPVNTTLE